MAWGPAPETRAIFPIPSGFFNYDLIGINHEKWWYILEPQIVF